MPRSSTYRGGVRRTRLAPYLLLAALMLGSGLGIGLGLSEGPTTGPVTSARTVPAVRTDSFCSPSQLSATFGGYTPAGGLTSFVINVVNLGTKPCIVPPEAQLRLVGPNVSRIEDEPGPGPQHPGYLVLLPSLSNGVAINTSIDNWCSSSSLPSAIDVTLASVGKLSIPLLLPDLETFGCTDPSQPPVLLSPTNMRVWVPLSPLPAGTSVVHHEPAPPVPFLPSNACSDSDLSGTVTGEGPYPGMGKVSYIITIASTVPCMLSGYPTLRFSGPDGTVATTVTKGAVVGNPDPPSVVALGTGVPASFLWEFSDLNCTGVFTSLSFGIDGGPAAAPIELTSAIATTWCAGSMSGVSPFEQGNSMDRYA